MYPGGRSELDSSSLRSDAWHHRSDAITSGAAFIGISIALVGGEQYAAADDWAALIACVITFTASCSERTCSFDASGSRDPEGDSLKYDWQFGDGEVDTGVSVEHTYADGTGTSFSVELTVTETETAEELSDSIDQDVTVAEAVVPPTIPYCSIDAPGSLYEGDSADGIDNTVIACPDNQAALVCNFEWTAADPATPEQNFGLNNDGTCCWCNPQNASGVTGKVCFPDLPAGEEGACPEITVTEFNQILLETGSGRVCFVRDGRQVCYY